MPCAPRSKPAVHALRPVIMTAMAMMIGMVPMSLGLGEGGEQNAPLGRAVIGGLLISTVATLFFVPTIFSVIRGRRQPHIAPLNETGLDGRTEPTPALELAGQH